MASKFWKAVEEVSKEIRADHGASKLGTIAEVESEIHQDSHTTTEIYLEKLILAEIARKAFEMLDVIAQDELMWEVSGQVSDDIDEIWRTAMGDEEE